MCGISGIISQSGFSPNLLIEMNCLIRHRGPDDEGYLTYQPATREFSIYGGKDTPESVLKDSRQFCPSTQTSDQKKSFVGLGHRRLSILDTSSAGHQPMCSRSKQFWITYNGELYNYVELRDQLTTRGYTFVSESDTEVILHCWEEWGSDCLSRFNGMFGFLLLDAQNKRITAVRDRFGIKPLYYRIGADNTIAFASEIKQFTVLPDWQAKINGQRAYDFLVHSIIDHTDETLFKNVFQLRPGQIIELDLSDLSKSLVPNDKRLKSKRWYTLKPIPFTGNLESAGTCFQELLTDSINLRKRADVPIGSCLSGGMDSSTVVVLLNKLLQRESNSSQKTFSACSRVERFNEKKWIDIVKAHTDTQPHFVYPDLNNLLETYSKLTWHQDEPFGSTSIYAQWRVFQLASQHGVKVMLDGQGADEQLAGYFSFFYSRLQDLLFSGQFGTLAQELLALRRIHGQPLLLSMQYLANSALPSRVAALARRILRKETKNNLNWLDHNKLNAAAHPPPFPVDATRSSVYNLSYSQLTCSNVQMLLHWEDRNSMAHSVEARLPFLDYRLVEQVLGLPDDYKIAKGVTKRVLRQGMKGILPDAICNRMDKLGFETPEEVWMKNDQPELFRHMLKDSVDKSNGIITDSVFPEIDKLLSGKKQFNFLPWRIINFGTWIETFNIKQS